MAEQRPWFKLWVSALSDDALEALSLEDWARWARLGAHVKLHGERGAIVSRYPHDGLARVFRHSAQGGSHGGRESMAARVLATLGRLPGVTVEIVTNGHHDGATSTQRGSNEHPTSPPRRVVEQGVVTPHQDQPARPATTPQPGAASSIRVSFRNWKKYQEDSSADRTKEYRRRQKERDGQAPSQPDPHRDGQHASPRDDVEERRRESPYPPTSPTVTPPTSRPAHPPEAFNHDCAWPGRCVNAEYFDKHPGAGLPVRGKDDQQRMRPKQCPAHREQDEQPW